MTCSNFKPFDEKKLSIGEKLKNGYNPMVEGVRWSEKYATQIENLWKLIPKWLGQIIIFMSIFLLASGVQGIYEHSTTICDFKFNIEACNIFVLENRYWSSFSHRKTIKEFQESYLLASYRLILQNRYYLCVSHQRIVILKYHQKLFMTGNIQFLLNTDCDIVSFRVWSRCYWFSHHFSL